MPTRTWYESLSPPPGIRSISMMIASTTKTKNSELIGDLRAECTCSSDSDHTKARSRASAKVRRPVTATLLKPTKKKFSTTSHVNAAAQQGPTARINKFAIGTPPAPTRAVVMFVVANNRDSNRAEPKRPVANTVRMMPFGAAVELCFVSSAMWALASYPEKRQQN